MTASRIGGTLDGMDGMFREEIQGLSLYHWAVFRPWDHRVKTALVGRRGGGSRNPYHSLNISRYVGDDGKSVNENRRRAAEAMGVGAAAWTCRLQVHGNSVAVVDEAGELRRENDGMVTTRSGLLLAVALADCLPLLLYDPIRHAAAICHAGWKGTALGVADAAFHSLTASGSRAENLIAAVGPGIGPCCYTVGQQVAAEIKKSFPYPDGVFFKGDDGQERVDLEAANTARLRALGIEHIGRAGFCTACRTAEFFSHRKESGKTGRHAALLLLRELT